MSSHLLRFARRELRAVLLIALGASAIVRSPLRAQPSNTATAADSGAGAARASARTGYRHSTGLWVLGGITSILAHEAGHVAAAYMIGSHPYFRMYRGIRPTIYSGVDMRLEPHKQLVFSSAGLAVQALLDELFLDIPGAHGTSFGRGIVAGGLGTALFYVTLGRNGSASDILLMSRTSGLSKGEISAIVGGVAAVHALRIAVARGGPTLFLRPDPFGQLRVGVQRDGPLGAWPHR